MSIDSRSEMLLGKEELASLKNKTVAVFGLGGVGGTLFEALVRSGVGHIHIIDKDVVDESNLNRQILYKRDDIGSKKAGAAFLYAKAIRLDVEVLPECYLINKESLAAHDYSSCDILIDCVDDVEAKLALMEYSSATGIPLLLSLGMGNRLDPSKVYSCRLDKSEGDPLGKKIRGECRKRNIDMKKFTCVLSKEIPLVRGKKPSSMMMVPSSSGLLLAYLALSSLLKTKTK
ncbi:MAG: ThiF family adenylyltransferase [Bacilli bacterium]|jgi:tRNA A37 threonylcarbamoyladenosine dehydratase|nr:ThiF family adenylyltransferase [Bacilli bacterium]MCH4228574.1 ThiF family adenylyltransferase [Bacilli bacterium]MCH4277898.1 ThiF family adenylyltransferase [Bacilli bacterium]MCI2055250.1 ThiF family adenylyltransferase [Bacilli bacterium]